MMNLRALLESGELPPIAGGATLEEYDKAIAQIPDEKRELRTTLDSLVTNWLIASKSPDSATRQNTIETVGKKLTQLIAENPNFEKPIKTIHRYIFEEYREETNIGISSRTKPATEKPKREPKRQETSEADPSQATISDREWEQVVHELHRKQYQPKRVRFHGARERPASLIQQSESQDASQSQSRLWIQLVSVLLVSAILIGVNYLIGDPVGEAIDKLVTQLPFYLDSLQSFATGHF